MKTIFLIVLAVLPVVSFGNSEQKEGSPELVVHLLDYLAKDYGGAVQRGKIASKSEYSEQVEFASIVKNNTGAVEKLRADLTFINKVEKLQNLIRSKAEACEVSSLARDLQQQAIRLSGIQVAPTTWPDLSTGAKLFKSDCISCHGLEGKGDGIAGRTLDPKPANFYDSNLVWNSAPYKFFNTIRLGVPGTGMAAFSNFSDQEVWSLAFYLKSLPYQRTGNETSAYDSLSLKDIATLTDAEIAAKLGGKSANAMAVVGAVRTASGGSARRHPLQTANSLLDESLRLAEGGNFEEASRTALRAYLKGIEPIEPKARANLPGSVEKIEALMTDYRSSLEYKEPANTLRSKKDAISRQLNKILAELAENKMSAGIAFGAAFSIFLREGFEAILIIIVLVSILRATGQKKAIKWVHVGWLSAVAAGLVAWFASGILLEMSGLSRELLEGSISILAVAVLLYVGVWLHRYSEIKKWRAYLELKLRHGLSTGSYFALALVSFMAVFREAFEVVLFLRAIWIDLDNSGQMIASGGVLSSLILLIGLSFIAIRESRKLPLGFLFQICSVTMIVLAIILAGKGAHSLQEAGLLSVSSLGENFRIDLIGVYPSFQTLFAQIVVIGVFCISLLLERRKSQFEPNVEN